MEGKYLRKNTRLYLKKNTKLEEKIFLKKKFPPSKVCYIGRKMTIVRSNTQNTYFIFGGHTVYKRQTKASLQAMALSKL